MPRARVLKLVGLMLVVVACGGGELSAAPAPAVSVSVPEPTVFSEPGKVGVEPDESHMRCSLWPEMINGQGTVVGRVVGVSALQPNLPGSDLPHLFVDFEVKELAGIVSTNDGIEAVDPPVAGGVVELLVWPQEDSFGPPAGLLKEFLEKGTQLVVIIDVTQPIAEPGEPGYWKVRRVVDVSAGIDFVDPCGEELDAQFEGTAKVLGRPADASLLLDWAEEVKANFETSSPGPIGEALTTFVTDLYKPSP